MISTAGTDRATDKVMKTAGFEKVEQKKYDLPISEDASMPFKICGGIVKPHVMGVATR